MPTGSERLIWGFGDESTLDVVKATLPAGDSSTSSDKSTSSSATSATTATLSATICWENYMPLLRNHWYQQGVQLYCAPTVDGRESWAATMRHIAQEGRCFVLAAAQFAQQKVRLGPGLPSCGYGGPL